LDSQYQYILVRNNDFSQEELTGLFYALVKSATGDVRKYFDIFPAAFEPTIEIRRVVDLCSQSCVQEHADNYRYIEAIGLSSGRWLVFHRYAWDGEPHDVMILGVALSLRDLDFDEEVWLDLEKSHLGAPTPDEIEAFQFRYQDPYRFRFVDLDTSDW
jgi:hypothetical protein